MLKNCGTQTIETERLLLRRFSYQDAESMLDYWIGDPAVQSMYMEPAYQTEAEVGALIGNWTACYEQEDYYRWAIINKASGKCIGQIAFFLVESRHHFGEIEYCIGRQFQGQGYCTEAARAILAYGFTRVRFHKIQVSHRTDNPASKRVIQKCGFTYEGTSRDFFHINGTYVDRLFYSMLESEWKER